MPLRLLPYALIVAAFLLSLWACIDAAIWWIPTVVFGSLTVLGAQDLLQTHSAVRRNYPLLGRIRFLAEDLRPFVRQYFIEDDNHEAPFSHAQRTLVYQRAKSALDKLPFGTERDLYVAGHEWINHSLVPVEPQIGDFRVQVGGARCTKPYSASVLNISAMSFGSLSSNAVLALSRGAARGGFYHDTGEGGLSDYHREGGGDLVWEIGSGYFSCRDESGGFDPEQFSKRAQHPRVKMIELKLSQGAKPGHGGILPGQKVSAEIAETRGVPKGVDCVSPAAHSTFSTPLELLQFIDRLRELSGGKPVGFKLAIGHPWEWFGIAKAMLQSKLLPDFIVVDGAEGGTGAAPLEFADNVGLPLREALLLVHNTLVGCGLRDQIKIGAAGKVISAFDVARTIALGADWCNAARGFMFSLGCIQSQHCHTGRCPTGVATQDPARAKALDVADKASKVQQFHHNTLHALAELLGAAGIDNPAQLGPEHIMRRLPTGEIRAYAFFYPQLAEGSLLDRGVDLSPYREFWKQASAEFFNPPQDIAALRMSKSR